MSKPLLSIGMIVKNEIRCIERCLQALQPLRDAIPCQLVIADTGSTDGTREVAAQYADVLFDFAWVNDFSAARNAVLDRCTGAWYLAVDADETLDPEIGELIRFLANSNRGYTGAAVIVRNYATKEMVDGDYSDFLAIRMIRMSTGVRYSGAIHEHWTLPKHATIYSFSHTIFHHDGYAALSPEQVRQKAERNMPLLRAALEEDPNNPRRLMQCVESCSIYPEEQQAYLARAMEGMMGGNVATDDNTSAPLCRYAVCMALDQRQPQAVQWLTWGEEHYHESVFFQVDVAASATVYYYNQKDYAQSAVWAKRYLKGLDDFLHGRYHRRELLFSTLTRAKTEPEHRAKAAAAYSLAETKCEEEALEVLRTFDPLVTGGQVLNSYLRTLEKLELNSGTAEDAEALCAHMMEVALAANQKDVHGWKNRSDCLMMLARRFQNRTEKGWRVFRKVPGDLGQAAKAMDEGEPAALSALLADIQNWKEVPTPVIQHALACGVPLPERFYSQKGTKGLRNTAILLAKADQDFARHMADHRWEPANTLVKLQFQYDMTAGALQLLAPLRAAGDRPRCRSLCETFIGLAGEMLPRIYSPQLLECPEDWEILPGMHHFGLWVLTAERAKAAGDQAAALRALRQGLETAPRMKDMVEFLLEEAEKVKASPEMLALAEQVQAILSRYPANDPAVAALKRSEQYQKMKFLIEGPNLDRL